MSKMFRSKHFQNGFPRIPDLVRTEGSRNPPSIPGANSSRIPWRTSGCRCRTVGVGKLVANEHTARKRKAPRMPGGPSLWLRLGRKPRKDYRWAYDTFWAVDDDVPSGRIDCSLAE